jgi:pimeloyl-ACP methyl ester carboxylesterase
MARRFVDDGWRPPADGVLVVHPEGRRPPVFGICGAFGHALRLLLIGQALDPDQPFHGLQPPGMDWAQAGIATIDAMAAHYAERIRVAQPRGPYRLLGTSFGGILAFEAARRLQADGETIALLAMVDTRPPDCVLGERIDRMPRREWSDPVDGVDPLVAMGARVARQHGDALARHRLTRPIDGEILYFRCAEPAIDPAQDRRGLWARFATGGVRDVPVPGWHGSFHREPQLSAVVAALQARLAERAG